MNILGDVVEKTFDEKVLQVGGSTHFKVGSKWYAISVMTPAEVDYSSNTYGTSRNEYRDAALPKKYKHHIRNAVGHYVFVRANSYAEAQKVIDSLFGKGHYRVSASSV